MVGESVVMFYYKLELLLSVVFYILRFDFFVFAKILKKNIIYLKPCVVKEKMIKDNKNLHGKASIKFLEHQSLHSKTKAYFLFFF
jgi:hypothetical protein